MKIYNIILLIMFFGCASKTVTTGTVAMKVNSTDAHIAMKNGELKVGDRIDAYRNNCVRDAYHQNRNSSIPICKKEKIGSGIVTSLLNEHYSVVKFDTGVDFREGTVIEKQ